MLDKLTLFIEIAKCENISQAAANLYLSQSTASSQLKSLENELQAQLFDRINRRIVLNENGKIFLTFAQKTMAYYSKTVKDINKTQQLSGLTLSFCAGIFFNIYFLPYILQQFTKQYSNINIQITTQHTDEIINNIRNKKYDFGIINANDPKDIDRTTFEVDFIYKYPLYLVCSPKSPLAKRRNVLKNELSNQTFVFNKKTSYYRAYVSSYLIYMNIEPNKQITIESMEATKKAVINNLGISILPEYMVKKELKSNELAYINLKDSMFMNRTMCCIHNAKRNPSQISLEFIRICREYFQELEKAHNNEG